MYIFFGGPSLAAPDKYLVCVWGFHCVYIRGYLILTLVRQPDICAIMLIRVLCSSTW
jgi:hypothetical protein